MSDYVRSVQAGAQAYPLVALGTFTIASQAASQTVTLPGGYTTKAGDAIAVGYATGNGTGFQAMSGAGATWSSPIGTGGVFNASLQLGYNCSAGQTSVTTSGNTGKNLDMVIGVYRGVRSASNPVAATGSSFFNSTVTHVENPTLTQVAGQLFVGCMACDVGLTFVNRQVAGAGGLLVAQSNAFTSVALVSVVEPAVGGLVSVGITTTHYANFGMSLIPAP